MEMRFRAMVARPIVRRSKKGIRAQRRATIAYTKAVAMAKSKKARRATTAYLTMITGSENVVRLVRLRIIVAMVCSIKSTATAENNATMGKIINRAIRPNTTFVLSIANA